LIQAFEDDQDDIPLLPVYSRSIDEGYEALEPDMSDYNLRYLFDGGCSICTSLVKMLKSRKGHELIYFEDISAPTFSPTMVRTRARTAVRGLPLHASNRSTDRRWQGAASKPSWA
jgi:hypothetical protein